MTIVYGSTRTRSPEAAEKRIAELEAALSSYQKDVPVHVRAAMAFVSMCQSQALTALPYAHRGDIGVMHRDMRPTESGAFDAACDAVADWFDSQNKSVRAYVEKGRRKRRKTNGS